MKGFIGGIPVALLAVAAQAQYAERHEHDFHPQAGGTAIGGPSGNDNDGGFVSPYSASIKTDTKVNQWNKDDHSIKLKHTDVYPRPPVVPVPFGHPVAHGPQVPGMGPFGKEKRGGAPGGTAIGGPSGNDEGQSFDMSFTGVFNTEVEDENKDDHSIDIKNKNIYAPPPFVVHPPPYYGGPSRRGENRPAAVGKRFGPHFGGTAIGGPSGNDGGQSFSAPTNIQTSTDVSEHNEDDHSIGLKHEDIYAHPFGPFRRSENHGPAGHFEPHPEPHFENHPEPHYAPHYSPTYAPHYEPHTTLEHEITSLKNNNNGPAAGSITFGRRGVPGPHGPPGHFEPHPEPHYENHPEPHYAPHYSPTYAPHYEPHTTFESEITSLKNNNNGPAAGSIVFGRRAYAPTPETSVGGGTAIGGPSGNDGGSDFSAPNNVDVSTDVNEHNEDNHAITGDFTHVHPGASPEHAREEHVEAPQCAAQVHQVVHTVTKTQYKTAEATQAVSPSAPAFQHDSIPANDPHHPAGAEVYAPSGPAPSSPADAPHHPAGADAYAPPAPAPSSPADAPHHPSGADAYAPPAPAASSPGAEHPSAGYSGWAQPSGPADPSGSFPQKSVGAASYPSFPKPSTGADPYGSSAKPSSGANPYPASAPAPSDYAAQRPSYSKIAVHVPMATPAEYGSFSQPTPSVSGGKVIPTGAFAEHKASPSSSASAAVSHGVMFEGGAARLSGGIVSAAAAVMGVLAFIL
ncbi:uncharacterized protein N7487_004577 [Penicillium crustosum]|uniref:uncharacterized protein n=1 Tax=Penicillium crustosum TaxID=36656 RepID=UPI0023A0098E|nr:uncharacterized protein N7487_004577 [Penicillium crustosum]KAJ5410218.1 hypothetical protein N7487_004577 [Penicillium crustosum]